MFFLSLGNRKVAKRRNGESIKNCRGGDGFFSHGPRPTFLVEHGSVPHRVEYGDDLGPPLHAHEIFAPWAEYSIHIVLKPIFPIIPFFPLLCSSRRSGLPKKKKIIHIYRFSFLSLSLFFLAALWHDRSSQLKVHRNGNFSKEFSKKWTRVFVQPSAGLSICLKRV